MENMVGFTCMAMVGVEAQYLNLSGSSCKCVSHDGLAA